MADLVQNVTATNDCITATSQESLVCVASVSERVGITVFSQWILHRNALLKELKYLQHTANAMLTLTTPVTTPDSIINYMYVCSQA